MDRDEEAIELRLLPPRLLLLVLLLELGPR